MAQTLNLRVAGLWLDPNPLSEVIDGALAAADDCVIQKPGVAESRRGQDRYGLLTNIPDKLYAFDNTLLVHFGSSMAYDSNGNGTFTTYSGSFDSPDGSAKPRSFEGNQNFYLTSSSGIRKLQEATGTFSMAGAPKGLGGTYTLVTSGFMSNNVQVAYRIIWGYIDDNDNRIVGAPSQRMVVVNETGTTVDVTQTWLMPDQVVAGWFYEVYRSAESAGAAFPPDDELGLVKQADVTSSDVSNGYISFTDAVPNALRGATLYTSPSQQGILQANDPPPYAVDICQFRERAFFANTKLKQRYFGTLVSVGDNTYGGSFGYQTNNGDTHTNTTIDGLTKAASVVIQDLTYTADATGPGGNDISITYTAGGTAGAEVVTVVGNSITVQIENNVSTANQIKTAVDASAPASALISVSVSGTGTDTQTTVAQTFLEDGFNTSTLNVGMRVVGTGVQAGTLIVSIDSTSSITVTPATTATATVALVFQDRFSINSMNYWAASTADYANRQFIAVLPSATTTPGEAIEQTALNLIAAINSDPNNTIVDAYYMSNFGELPGQFLIEERAIGGASFFVTSTNGESFSPQLPLLTETQVSDNDARVNRVYFSKIQQYEAVPVVNFLDVGSENFPIVRILALRDSIFVFKDIEGVFRITGTSESNFIVSLFDSTCRIRAPESAVVLNNNVFTFTEENVVAVDESGVVPISDPLIQSALNQISSDLYPSFDSTSFGVAYDTDRTYQFWTLTDPSDPYPTQAYCYNQMTQAWTTFNLVRSCGLVSPYDGKEYMGNPDDLYIYKERKNFNRTDYADREIDITIAAVDELELTINDSSELTEGDLVKQDDLEAIITEVVDATTITVNLEQNWDLAAAQVFQKIPALAKWTLNPAGNPGILKHYAEATFFFKDAPFYTVNAQFQTDLIESSDEIELAATSGNGWGEFSWGERPWSVPGGRALTIRTLIPLECQRGSWINVQVENREAYSNFSLTGVSIQLEPMSSHQR